MERGDLASDFCVSTGEVLVLGVKSESPPYETVMAFWSTLPALSVSVPLPPPAAPFQFLLLRHERHDTGRHACAPAIGSISTSMLIATIFFFRKTGIGTRTTSLPERETCSIGR